MSGVIGLNEIGCVTPLQRTRRDGRNTGGSGGPVVSLGIGYCSYGQRPGMDDACGINGKGVAVVGSTIAIIDGSGGRHGLACASVSGVIGLNEIGCVTPLQRTRRDGRNTGGSGGRIIGFGVGYRSHTQRPGIDDTCGINDKGVAVVVAAIAIIDGSRGRQGLACAGMSGVIGLNEIGCVTSLQRTRRDGRNTGGSSFPTRRSSDLYRSHTQRPGIDDTCGINGKGVAVVV